MFDPLDISHDALVAQILSLKKQIPEEKPAAAFLAVLLLIAQTGAPALHLAFRSAADSA
jgi:hypothetical protein